ncbi:MAG: hypothetical protein GAK33_00908 [Burkholderia lata]|uniref:Uncharacterized protein n=1 Tax=Burkholderia lata (strain ATCC 17760 / DSM 23089 / LMG 22485 / NCIMB 9086 / R18194 / 383) TaxID=482957 RepID=A0A833PWX6_BURL3|nr:hypothetical protein [Burkholderia lata]KAF1039908.1 MAG: hypothetical protein GAK33_00908 [Burkholderia lata]
MQSSGAGAADAGAARPATTGGGLGSAPDGGELELERERFARPLRTGPAT